MKQSLSLDNDDIAHLHRPLCSHPCNITNNSIAGSSKLMLDNGDLCTVVYGRVWNGCKCIVSL